MNVGWVERTQKTIDQLQKIKENRDIDRLEIITGLRFSFGALSQSLGGWMQWDESWRYLAELDNVWVDTSSSLYHFTPEDAVTLLRRYRPDRVCFATDFPMWDPVVERQRFDALALTDAEKEAIGRRNIEAFLKQF